MIRLAFALFLAPTWLLAQEAPQPTHPAAPALPPGPAWTAEWIGPAASEAVPDTNAWVAYRHTFTLPERPAGGEPLVARVSADSRYWLWLNREPVVREGSLKRGPAPGAGYYDAVDLSAYVRPGENTLAVLVWYWGKSSFSHVSSGRPALVFELDAPGATVRSDAAWKARVHPAFERTGPPHPNFRLSETNIRYDARRALDSWTRPGYDDGDWPQARAYGSPPVAPWGPLAKRPIPLWKDFGVRPYENADALPAMSRGDTLVAALPYNAHVSPTFRIDAPAGLIVDVRTDNYFGGSAFNLRAEYVTRAGEQAWEMPGWINGHAVHYHFPEGVRILDLGYRETGYGADFAGTFTSSDDSLDVLWQKALRTLYVTMRDTYMDCPDRERAQWWGDVVLELGESFYALDPSSHALARKGILELVRWQRPDSTLYSPVPSGPSWTNELPMQMLASVGWYGFWTYYLHSGDAELIHEVYPSVKAYLDVWQLGEDGLVVPRAGGWTWGDWGAHKDMPVLYNGWYALALQAQREMARLTGHHGDIPEIEAKLASLHANVDRVFWTGTAYRSPGHEGPDDDRAQALAVLAGFAQPERYPALRRVLLEQRHSSPYMEKYVGEALIRMGYVEDALARIKERWGEMIGSPITTLWEGWELNSMTYGGGTYNHAWSGGPLTLLSQYVAGVAPLEAGYATFEVAPRLGPLAHARAVVPSVRGTIAVEARRHADGFALSVEVPEGTRALVRVPLDGARTVRLNGAVVWTQAGGAGAVPDGVRVLGADDAHVRVWVPGGAWRFVAEAA